MHGADTMLIRLGWDDSWREALSGVPTVGLPKVDDGASQPCEWTDRPGRIVRVDRGLCSVLTDDGPVRASFGADVLAAMASDPVDTPCTGDWCTVRTWPDGPVTIDRLAPRRGCVRRAGAARSSLGQVLAANVDTVAIVVALHPEPNLGRVERLLTIAWESAARPLIVLTKADLVVDADDLAEDIAATSPGVEVICTSTTTGMGLEALRGWVGLGRTMALVGSSGHGKSSLVNALAGAEVLPTKEIRADGKGRHTSVRRELVLLPGGGVVIDTPGLRGVGLLRDEGSLDETFPDIAALVAECRFHDCRHDREPGCAVRAAVDSGALSVRRWQSYARLARELQHAEARTDARLRAELARQQRRRTRETRHHPRR